LCVHEDSLSRALKCAVENELIEKSALFVAARCGDDMNKYDTEYIGAQPGKDEKPA
jgi:hypothetical protein